LKGAQLLGSTTTPDGLPEGIRAPSFRISTARGTSRGKSCRVSFRQPSACSTRDSLSRKPAFGRAEPEREVRASGRAAAGVDCAPIIFPPISARVEPAPVHGLDSYRAIRLRL